MTERFRCRRIEYDGVRIDRITMMGGLPHNHGEHACITMEVDIFNAEII